ncbi:MAG: hypothetical protein PUE12_04455 [Oscillospiraceae bacterium]|nr:hypothetical protein [Oscillospiraceae bacterium]
MKIKILAAAALLVFSLSGCGSKLEVRDRAFVQSAGIEYEDEQYEICLKLFEDSKYYNGRGNTFREAVNDAEKMQGKDFFTGHMEIVSVRDEEKMPLLESLVNENVSSGCLVVLRDDPVNYISRNDPEKIKGMISTAERNGTAEKVNICDVINSG